MRKIDNIILHCSDSLWGCAREIRQWHLQRGWKDIGYQFVILNGRPTPKFYVPALDGSIECGRYLDEDIWIEPNEIGSHALGYNDHSVGICLVGVNQFTPAQMTSLKKMLFFLMTMYGISPEAVLGHCETAQAHGKTCPNFDVGKLREELRKGVSHA